MRYVKALAKETRNVQDGPFAHNQKTGYGECQKIMKTNKYSNEWHFNVLLNNYNTYCHLLSPKFLPVYIHWQNDFCCIRVQYAGEYIIDNDCLS